LTFTLRLKYTPHCTGTPASRALQPLSGAERQQQRSMGLAGLMAMDDEDEEISVVARGRNVDQGTRGRIMRGVRGFLWFLFSVWTEFKMRINITKVEKCGILWVSPQWQ